MDALPEFRIVTPKTLAEAIAARVDNPRAMPLGGGTDLVVNIRRGIVAPPVLIDMNRVPELHTIHADEKSLELGASVTLSEIARHPAINRFYPVVTQAAAHIAGPHTATWARSAAISVSTRAASSITRANGG